MDELHQKDFRALLEFLNGTYSALDLDPFVTHVITHLPALVPCAVNTWNEYRARTNCIVRRQEPVVAPAGSERVWERHANDHSILQHFLSTGDGRAVRFTDFVTQRQFEGTGLYDEFFRPLGLRHQLAFMLRERGRLRVAVALQRDALEFSERERFLLNLLRPHLMGDGVRHLII